MSDGVLYEVTEQAGYIKAAVWGEAGGDVFEASTEAVVALRDKTHINNLLCDIRRLQPLHIDIRAQSHGIGSLLKIRTFDRIAFVLGDPMVSGILHSTLGVARLSGQFQSFDDEAEAIAWLTAPQTDKPEQS